MPRRFDFISPGVSIREVDESTVPTPTADDGILLIGHAPQGPANVPIKINNLEDFYRVFGKPVSGKGSNSTDVWRDGNQQATTYAMYAAQAWLASGTSPVTFVRTLGQDQLASKQATGYVPAGWNSGQEIHATTAASNANALGLFIMPSASSGTTSGTLAAIIYTTGSNWALSGTIGADPAASTTAALNTLIRSSTGTNAEPSTFTLVHSSSTVDEKYVVHFDRKKQDGYIRNVLNCNPQKTKAINYAATAETYFLGETFDEPVTRLAGDNAGEQFGMLVPLTDGTVHYSNRELEAQASKTGYFINRNPSPTANFGSYTKSTHEKLFRLCSLHEGEWFGKNYGVRIENIRVGSTANPTSTFSVVIVDSAGNEVEQFDNLNLNESSANFIGKMIGDQYQEWNDTLDKYMLKGEYSNRSDYVRVEMANDWKSGIADERMVPFGVWGPTKPNTLTISSGSATAGTNVIAKRVDDATMHFGHAALTATFFANMKADLTCSLAFPDLKLTDENSNNSGNYTKDYVFGVRHMLDGDNQPKKSLWYSPDYKDLVRALPSGLNIHEDGTKTQISWIFSLDDIREEAGTNSTKFYYENGSHAAGNSFTGNSGSAKLITQGVRQFNAAFFGGSDGLDIRQVDPFSVVNGLASGQNENKHYAYHSVKRVFDVIADKDLMSYDIVSMPGLLNSTLTQDLITIAEDRADTLAIIDLDGGYRKPYEANGVEALGTSTAAIAKAETLDYDTSYAATYYPPVRLRDTTSGTEDVTVVPPSVAAIGAIAKSEATSQGPWFAPAGFNRGGIGVLGGSAGPRVAGTLEHLTKKDRDDLYEQNINPIARFPSIGEIVIFGQKTLQQSPSALDRINVRRLMIFLKKRIGNVADTILFDQNVNTTWLRFKTQADAILSDVKSRFGLTEYKLVLDETTTTADLVDRNIMYAKIFVKPARAIEFIAIDFVITRSGVEF